MDTPIETSGYTHNGMEYDEKVINSIGAERAKEIKERVDAELLRRRFYGSEYSVDFIKYYYISVFGSDLSSLTAQKTGN